ncbi:MAG: transposase [bacterium]|nr:transposase [bacterium]MDE0290885.1 transposase [bacterium]MDE0439790.1 transposase [bacterium]
MIEDLRNLVLYRREQDLSLNREVNRLHADLAQISPGYQQTIRTRLTLPSALTKAMRLISADRSIRADIARRRVRTIRGLIKLIKELDAQIGQLVEASGTTLTDIRGIGPLGAAEILAQVGDPTKYPTKARFAMANGTAPLHASSGRVVRHRLNRGGNRRLNRAIHIAAITQIRRPGTEGRLYY